jgi:hypothetical protein
MRSLNPIIAAAAFLPVSDLLAAWVAAGSAIVGISFVGFLVVKFGRPGAKARLGV